MKLSADTVSVLKNFLLINPAIVVKPGNRLATITQSKTMLAEAIVSESFPIEARFFDLSKFIGAVGLLSGSGTQAPELEFGEKQVVVSEGRRRMTLAYTAPAIQIVTPPDTMKDQEWIASFELGTNELGTLSKAVGLMDAPEIAIVGAGGVVSVKSLDGRSDSFGSYSIDVGETDKSFTAVVKSEYIRMMPRDYRVEVSRKLVRLSSLGDGIPLKYWVAIEQTSKFD